MEELKSNIENLVNEGNYMEAVNVLKKVFKFSVNIVFKHKGHHFVNDKDFRNIYRVAIKTQNGLFSYDFVYRVAINTVNGIKPTEFDVLSCLSWFDIGSFEDFCSEYGYESEDAQRVYNAVTNETENLERIFTDEQIKVLAILR